VLGSNQRRLSRRFYSTLAPPESPPLTSTYAVRGAFAGRRRPLCVRGCRVPGSVRSTDGRGPAHGRGRKRPRTGPAGAVMLTAPARIPALTCHFRMPVRCRRPPRHRGLPQRPGYRGPRRCAGWRRSPGRRCSGRRSSAGPRRRARRGARPRWHRRPQVLVRAITPLCAIGRPSDTLRPHGRRFPGMRNCHQGTGSRQRRTTGVLSSPSPVWPFGPGLACLHRNGLGGFGGARACRVPRPGRRKRVSPCSRRYPIMSSGLAAKGRAPVPRRVRRRRPTGGWVPVSRRCGAGRRGRMRSSRS
jgi:hypothetical protein